MPPAEKKDLSPTAGATAAITATLETVIIFDWDDTLLASSFLSGKGYRLDNNLERSAELECQLKELEQSVINVLTLALSFGSVHIVTNAETGWVQMSAQKFIPGVVSLLSKVKVVSARSTYEAQFPDAPLKWKFYAFQEKLSSSFTEHKTEKNVISFGDSYVEREAVRAVTKGLLNTRTKSVKFAERPSMEQLRRQIELVSNCFQYIYNHDGDLDLQLTVTVSSPTSAPAPAPPSPSQHALQMAAPNRTTPPTTPTHAPQPVSAPSTPKLVPKSPAHAPITPRATNPSHAGGPGGSQSQHYRAQQQQTPMKPAPIVLPPPQSPHKAGSGLGQHTHSHSHIHSSHSSHSHMQQPHPHAMSLSLSMNSMMLGGPVTGGKSVVSAMAGAMGLNSMTGMGGLMAQPAAAMIRS